MARLKHFSRLQTRRRSLAPASKPCAGNFGTGFCILYQRVLTLKPMIASATGSPISTSESEKNWSGWSTRYVLVNMHTIPQRISLKRSQSEKKMGPYHCESFPSMSIRLSSPTPPSTISLDAPLTTPTDLLTLHRVPLKP